VHRFAVGFNGYVLQGLRLRAAFGSRRGSGFVCGLRCQAKQSSRHAGGKLCFADGHGNSFKNRVKKQGNQTKAQHCNST